MAKIIGQQGETRYLIDAGTDDQGLRIARIYDAGTDSVSDPPMPVESITAMSPGWNPPTDPRSVLATIADRADELL